MSILPPECEQLLISGYVLGDLSPGEATLFAEMLAENPSLNQRVREMQSALNSAYDPVEVTPPPKLRDRILNAANIEVTSSPNSETTTIARTPIAWNKILGAIALGIITILGLNNYRLWQNLKLAEARPSTGDRLTYLRLN